MFLTYLGRLPAGGGLFLCLLMANGDLTLKEVFERLVVMETKLTVMSGDSKKTKRMFQSYVLIMVILLITNIFVHVLGMIR